MLTRQILSKSLDKAQEDPELFKMDTRGLLEQKADEMISEQEGS
jgi:hypothetical protein